MSLTGLALGHGVVLAFCLAAATREKMMVPERYPDAMWGISLFTTAWSNGALAVIASGATGTDAYAGVGQALLTGVTLGTYSWGWWLLLPGGAGAPDSGGNGARTEAERAAPRARRAGRRTHGTPNVVRPVAAERDPEQGMASQGMADSTHDHDR